MFRALASKPMLWLSLVGLLNEARNHGVIEAIQAWAAAEALEKAGLELDAESPLSDASFCNALYKKTGVQFRTLKDRASIEEDLQTYAINLISQKTGFQMTVTNFRDVEGLKLDLVNIGLWTVQQRTGIPIGSVSGTPQDWGVQIKEQLFTYAEAELRQKLASDAQGIAEKMGELVDLDALAGEINKRLDDIGSTQGIDVRGLALGIAQQVSAGAVSRFQVQAAKMNKMDRRAVQNREAQRRFRAKWGDRREYLPVAPHGDTGP
jgi:hypothetical protein